MPQLRLHGPPRVALDDGQQIVLSAREAALLAWLHAEGPTPRARLAGLLWPAGTDAQARANLRQTLARLRRAAGEVVTDGDGLLRLCVPVQPADDPSRPLLGGLEFDDAPDFAQWLATRRDEAQRRRQREGLTRAQAHLAARDFDAALAAADALLDEQPEHEAAWRLRMEVLYQRGDRAAAIAAWDACRNSLRSAFGIAPSAATNELGRLILASDDAPPGSTLRPVAAALLPVALRRPPRLVGRDALLAAIARALALGRSVVVTGPGGIGKSRVLQQAAAASQPALLVSARPGDAMLPGDLLARLVASALQRFEPPLDAATRRDLTRLVPAPSGDPGGAVAPALRSEVEHRRVLASVLRALSACQVAGLRLVVVDDLHFADDASLAVLQFLVGHWLAPGNDTSPTAPQVLLAGRADEWSPAAEALVDIVARHARGTRFDIAPFSVAEVQALVDSLPALQAVAGPGPAAPALAVALHATVGGNPAFVLEALRSLWLDGFAGWVPGAPLPVPATLVESVRARLQRLPEEALQLAQLAAVAQTDFDPLLAARTFGRTPLAMAPLFAALETAQVFHGAAFSHDLVLEAVQRSLPAALAAPLHRQVADHLAQHAGPPARVAHHLLAAGERRAAVPWLLDAARAARGRWQLAEAAAGFAAAAEGLDAVRERESALAAWWAALRCWLVLRRTQESRAALDAAAALVRQGHERAMLQARELHHLLNTRQLGDAAVSAASLVDELFASVGQLDPEELVYALRAVCTAVQYGLSADRVLVLCEALRPAAVRAGGDVLAGFALARAGPLLWDSQPREAADELEAVWPLLGEGSDPEVRRSVANQLMRVRQALGDLPGAIALGQTLLTWMQPGEDDAVYEADVLNLVGMMQVAQGRAAAGLARIDALSARLQAVGEPMHELFALTIALSFIATGRHDDAQAWLDRHAQPPGREGFAMYDQVHLLARARLAAARGEPVAPWCQRLAALPTHPAGGLLMRRVALATLQNGTLPELERLLADVVQRGQAGLQRSVALAAARAALAAGQRDAAVAHARAALGLAACVDAWTDEPASVWLVAGEVLCACGADDEGRAALRHGASWVEQGAAQWSDGAQRRAWLEGNPVHRALLERTSIKAPSVPRG